MGTLEPYDLKNNIHTSYTLSEACDLMRMLNKDPFGTHPNITWINKRTGEKSVIGSTSG